MGTQNSVSSLLVGLCGIGRKLVWYLRDLERLSAVSRGVLLVERDAACTFGERRRSDENETTWSPSTHPPIVLSGARP